MEIFRVTITPNVKGYDKPLHIDIEADNEKSAHNLFCAVIRSGKIKVEKKRPTLSAAK